MGRWKDTREKKKCDSDVEAKRADVRGGGEMSGDVRMRETVKRWDEGLEGVRVRKSYSVVFLPLPHDGVTRGGRRRRERKCN